jgi:hypothetical protein
MTGCRTCHVFELSIPVYFLCGVHPELLLTRQEAVVRYDEPTNHVPSPAHSFEPAGVPVALTPVSLARQGMTRREGVEVAEAAAVVAGEGVAALPPLLTQLHTRGLKRMGTQQQAAPLQQGRVVAVQAGVDPQLGEGEEGVVQVPQGAGAQAEQVAAAGELGLCPLLRAQVTWQERIPSRHLSRGQRRVAATRARTLQGCRRTHLQPAMEVRSPLQLHVGAVGAGEGGGRAGGRHQAALLTAAPHPQQQLLSLLPMPGALQRHLQQQAAVHPTPRLTPLCFSQQAQGLLARGSVQAGQSQGLTGRLAPRATLAAQQPRAQQQISRERGLLRPPLQHL